MDLALMVGDQGSPGFLKRLALAYAALVERCTFDEFWSALARSSIVDLFGKYSLADRIVDMRNFTQFMATVRKQYQSVWELKKFTHMNTTDPFRAVVVDYGFGNCKDAGQRMELRQLYKGYFGRGEDEMGLHEACVTGRLASFLQSVLGGLPVPPDVLENYYPLENCPLMGMVTNCVTICPETAADQVRAINEANGVESVVYPIPDALDEAFQGDFYDRAAFLGTGVRKRYYSINREDSVLAAEFVTIEEVF
jgi:hypothetical protein